MYSETSKYCYEVIDMRRAILLSLLFCFTLVTLVPSNVFVAANNRYFSEDFEGSEVDL